MPYRLCIPSHLAKIVIASAAKQSPARENGDSFRTERGISLLAMTGAAKCPHASECLPYRISLNYMPERDKQSAICRVGRKGLCGTRHSKGFVPCSRRSRARRKMNVMKLYSKNRFFCLAMAGIMGVLPFFGSPEETPAALQRFVTLFTGQDAAGFTKIIHSEITSEIDVTTEEVENFLKRYRSNSLSLESSNVDKRFKSEDGTTERFQATLSFRGPVLSPEYPNPSKLDMTLLWVMQDGKWWLERPLSIMCTVSSSEAYPTEAQNEIAARFAAAIAVLDQLGLPGKEDLGWVDYPSTGDAVAEYKELEKLHLQERGSKGVDARAAGVQVLLKGAGRSQGGLLQIYQGDFPSGPEDKRRPVPWDMFRDYVQAAIKLGNTYQKQAKLKDRGEDIPTRNFTWQTILG